MLLKMARLVFPRESQVAIRLTGLYPLSELMRLARVNRSSPVRPDESYSMFMVRQQSDTRPGLNPAGLCVQVFLINPEALVNPPAEFIHHAPHCCILLQDEVAVYVLHASCGGGR